MWAFLFGFLFGVISVFIVAYLIFFNVFGEKVSPPPFIDQFQPLRIPAELKVFLRSQTEGNFTWESCLSVSLLLHFLFQEHKDMRRFRRWVYKKLQLELNDVTTKYAASRIITGVHIRELLLGTESPVIKNIRVEKFQMSENHELFDEISFEVDVDYRGGFETSVDLNMILGRSAHLSIKVMKLAGKARIVMSRRPYAHWYFAFIEMPQLDFKIDSKFQGHQLRKVIPLITTAFRKAFQRKHVWPNYKIRYRPILPHPLLQPAPPISSFDHIKLNGTGLEVTVLRCTRLNSKIFRADHTDVYCTVTLDQRPFLTNAHSHSTHCISVMLTFTRKGASDSIGLSFARTDAFLKAVKVSDVEIDSTAEKCGFKKGDVLLAINSVPIRNDKQAMRLLSGTAGDLLVLVERDLNYYFEDEIDDGHSNVDSFSEEFICISKKEGQNSEKRRGSDASLPSVTDSFTQTKDNDCLRKISVQSKNKSDEDAGLELDGKSQKNESECALKSIPTVAIQRPSTDIVRSRSDSDLFGEIGTGVSSILANSVKNITNNTLDEEEEEVENEKIDVSCLHFQDAISQSSTNNTNEEQLVESQEKKEGFESPKISSKRERIQARANEMALKISAGRAKFNDFIWHRTKGKDEIPSPTSPLSARSSILLFNSPSPTQETAECAMEADVQNTTTTLPITDENLLYANKGRVGSPSLEQRVMDKSKKKWIGRKRKSPSPSVCHRNTMQEFTNKSGCSSIDSNSANADNSIEFNGATKSTEGRHTPPPLITSRQTKSVPLTKNPLWGQSLHFGLEQRTTKYLNVIVYSRRKFGSVINLPTAENLSDSITEELNAPKLLGYTSVYIPQIVEDCQLTLSNSHREVFHLRPPSTENDDIPLEFTEMSRRTGFDARLCYGDVTIGFRFFPQGLPDATVRAAPNESPLRNAASAMDNSCHEAQLESADTNNPLQPTSPSNCDWDGDDEAITIAEFARNGQGTSKQQYNHKWTQFHMRHGPAFPCRICHGKIWLKWASRCTSCNFICHNKCVEKANASQECGSSPHQFDDNANFVVLDEKDLVASSENSTATNLDQAKDTSASGAAATTRRRRIATTVSEKLSTTWKNVGAAAAARRKTPSVPSGAFSTTPTFENAADSSFTAENSSSKRNSIIDNSLPSSPSTKLNDSENLSQSTQITTINKIIDANFLARLAGSKHLPDLLFEPGNAYNPQIIGETKSTGKHVFDEIIDNSLRKSRINEQIDLIQAEIDRVNQTRRRLTSSSTADDLSFHTSSMRIGAMNNELYEQEEAHEDAGLQRRRAFSSRALASINVDGAEIEQLDVKREALALLMLHYCSALSDCHEKEEEEKLGKRAETDTLDASFNSLISNPFDSSELEESRNGDEEKEEEEALHERQ